MAKTASKDKKVRADAQAELADKFSVKPVGKGWHIQGTPSLLTFFGCRRVIDEKLRKIKPSEVVGLKFPGDPTKMFPVERPIESAHEYRSRISQARPRRPGAARARHRVGA